MSKIRTFVLLGVLAAMIGGCDDCGTGSGSCSGGKCWVNGYTRSDGTKVKGYCRQCKSIEIWEGDSVDSNQQGE
jgi:hypothetical protein